MAVKGIIFVIAVQCTNGTVNVDPDSSGRWKKKIARYEDIRYLYEPLHGSGSLEGNNAAASD